MRQNTNCYWQMQRVSLKPCDDCETIIEYSNDKGVIYKNIDECNPTIKRKILITLNVEY